MQRFITLLVFLFFLHASELLNAQDPVYGIRYDGIGDNREFFSPYHNAETILGSRFSFSGGMALDSNTCFRVGLSYFYEYGSEFLELKPQLLLHYSFSNDQWLFKMGAFSRDETLNYPNAIISERYGYYNPTVDGFIIKRNYNGGEANLFVDWVSRQDSSRREQFMAGAFANQKKSVFVMEEYWYMFHNAGRIIRIPGESMEDYMGLCLLAGLDLSNKLPFDIFTLKTGVLTSAYRNRGEGMDFNIKSSSYSELTIDYRGFGLSANFKYGNKHQFSHGNRFYQNAENFTKLGFYFTPFKSEKVSGQFMWALNIANGDLDNQQTLRLIYRIGNL